MFVVTSITFLDMGCETLEMVLHLTDWTLLFLLGDTFGDFVFSIGKLATEIVNGKKGER